MFSGVSIPTASACDVWINKLPLQTAIYFNDKVKIKFNLFFMRAPFH